MYQKNWLMLLISNMEVLLSLVLPIKGYERENLPDFRKKAEIPPKSHRILMKTTPSESACQRTLL